MMTLIHRSDVTARTDSAVFDAAQETAPPLECCGCPSENDCRLYCVANYGARGGYCEGFLDLRCICVY